MSGAFYDHLDWLDDPFASVEDEDEDEGMEDDFDYESDEDEEDHDSLGPLMLACDTPGCLMPGPHFACECHTVEDMEAMYEEANEQRPA